MPVHIPGFHASKEKTLVASPEKIMAQRGINPKGKVLLFRELFYEELTVADGKVLSRTEKSYPDKPMPYEVEYQIGRGEVDWMSEFRAPSIDKLIADPIVVGFGTNHFNTANYLKSIGRFTWKGPRDDKDTTIFLRGKREYHVF